jgi:hypothetical protein
MEVASGENLLRTASIGVIMDFERTSLLYKQIDQAKKWDETPEKNRQNKEIKWFETVKSSRTGDYYQAQILIEREFVPSDWKPPHVDKKGRPLTYPIKNVNVIIRKRTVDGEYLLSRESWTALDSAGNPVSISMDDKQMYDDILPIYKQVYEDPRSRDSKILRRFERIEHRITYTEPYKPETIQKLYDTRNGTCSLVLKDESKGDKPPINIESFEDFRDKPFDELWKLATTPKTSLN